MTRTLRILASLLALVGATAVAANDAPLLLGAWQRSDGRVFTIAPSADDSWRFRFLDDGRSGRLHPTGASRWQAGPGFADREPAAVVIEQRAPDQLHWQDADGRAWDAERVPVHEQDFTVDADGVQLTARLVTPAGAGPFPLVVLVHGSERLSAVGSWHDPYMFAAHGIAGVVYDKRGTGRSRGEFTADFQRLAADAVAVARAAEATPAIASGQTGFAGFSQGGWVAPLAASLHGEARAVLIAYGTIDSPFHEDRWQCREALRAAGDNSPSALAKLDTWVTATHAVLHSDLQEGWDAYRSALRAVKSQPWFKRIDRESAASPAGFAPYPAWVLRIFARRRLPPQLDWDYDSHALLARLDLPMFWQLASDDQEAPSSDTAAAVHALQQVGKPHRLRVYPGTDHGLITFRVEDGKRVLTGYHPAYMRDALQFWREQFGLQKAASH